MDIVLQGTVAWLNKSRRMILAEVGSMELHPDIDKVRAGQKITIILEQRKAKGGDKAQDKLNQLPL